MKKKIILLLLFSFVIFNLNFASVYAEGNFKRGDANQDSRVDIADAVYLLDYLFKGGEKPACLDAADSNDDGGIDLSDPVYLLAYLFKNNSLSPPEPFLTIGPDPTQDSLNCNLRKFVLKFYLDPALDTDINFTKRMLVEYVHDMNYILSKNTDRKLEFNPETGIILTKTKPQTDSATPPLPDDGYEVWAHVSLSNYAPTGFLRSYGGRGGMDVSGAAVLADLKWAKIHNVPKLVENTRDMEDYWIQINNMIHELEHSCGAGIGEYYSLSQVIDTTGVSPQVNINAFNTTDSYWASKADFMADPLLWNIYGNARFGNPRSRSSLLQAVKFSELSAKVCNGKYRNGVLLPDVKNIKIKVLRKDNLQPIAGADLKIWSVSKMVNPPQSVLLYNLTTNNSGEATFDWAGKGSLHTNVNLLRTIKAYKEGFAPVVKHISAFDAERVKVIDNKDLWNVEILM